MSLTTRPQACLNYFLADRSLERRERQGVWLGSACDRLGVGVGTRVMAREMALGLDGMDMKGNSLVHPFARGRVRRCAYDFTISASKSVSIAALCLGDEEREAAREAFFASMAEVAGVIENLALTQAPAFKRERTSALAGAAFVHERSRYEDPHLHGHYVCLNATINKAGEWRAYDPTRTLKAIRQVDGMFQLTLARELRARGLAAQYRGRMAEIKIGRAVIERLSTAMNTAKELARKARPLAPDVPEWMIEQACNDRTRPGKGKVARKDFSALLADDYDSVLAAARAKPVRRRKLPELSDSKRLALTGEIVSLGAAGSEERVLDGCLRFLERNPTVGATSVANAFQAKGILRHSSGTRKGDGSRTRRKKLARYMAGQGISPFGNSLKPIVKNAEKHDNVVLLEEGMRI